MTRSLSVTLFATIAFVMGGCSNEGGKFSVAGKVVVDGQPLENGGITFLDEKGTGRPEMSVISNGSYKADVAPGTYRVMITSEKLVPALTEGPKQKEAMMRQYLPPKYSGPKSELAATVEGKSGQSFDFDLKTAK